VTSRRIGGSDDIDLESYTVYGMFVCW